MGGPRRIPWKAAVRQGGRSGTSTNMSLIIGPLANLLSQGSKSSSDHNEVDRIGSQASEVNETHSE